MSVILLVYELTITFPKKNVGLLVLFASFVKFVSISLRMVNLAEKIPFHIKIVGIRNTGFYFLCKGEPTFVLIQLILQKYDFLRVFPLKVFPFLDKLNIFADI